MDAQSALDIMGSMEPPETNSLMRGFYTVREAARLIEVGNARRILGWLQGYPKRKIGPIIARDYPPLEKRQELSFLDLLEIRFVEHFREQGIRIATLRRAVETARIVWKTSKPLATQRIRFLPRDDGKDILVEEVLRPTVEDTKDPKLWSLLTAQYEIYTAIRTKLVAGLVFDAESTFAKRWTPRPERFPKIVIDPLIAYGQPAGPSHVPTSVIYQSWKAEEERLDPVADWYGIPSTEVGMAIEFERSLEDSKRLIAAGAESRLHLTSVSLIAWPEYSRNCTAI